MATNLRLGSEAERALREEALRSHRSQQEVLRAAVDRYLGLDDDVSPLNQDELVRSGKVRPPRTPYRRVVPADGAISDVSSLTLLDRDERF